MAVIAHPCNVCGKPWPSHEPVCVYVQTAQDLADAKAENARLTTQHRGAVEALQAAYELVTVDEARSSSSIVTQLREDLHDALGRLGGQ